MEIVNELTKLSDRFPKITMALGTFDGVHIGHKKIISRAVTLAKQLNGTSVVFTFSNHPLSVIAPERCPLQIVTQECKAEIIKSLGVDILLTIPFTQQFLELSATQFINLMVEKLSPKHIVIGPNYFFGYQRSGTPELLQSIGVQHNFKVEIHPAIHVDDAIVSSTSIRKMITTGNIDQAAKLLSRPVKVSGIVIHGAKRGGRILGYPTINLQVANDLALPANGVYAVSLNIKNTIYNGIANIGTNPTFKGRDRRLEVHILDFAGNLYGELVTVIFIKYIRGEITFSSPDALKMQIFQDIKKAKSYYI